jgi:predicted RNase H-like HicB family nuclease
MKQKEAITTFNAQYVCTFRPEPKGGYTVRCADFPELITNGRTLEEARAMAREALELCLEVYREEGRSIPASDADPQKTVTAAPANALAFAIPSLRPSRR